MRRFLTLYMTVNWHREFAVNFATFLKVCCDFFTFAPWFSYSPSYNAGKGGGEKEEGFQGGSKTCCKQLMLYVGLQLSGPPTF